MLKLHTLWGFDEVRAIVACGDRCHRVLGLFEFFKWWILLLPSYSNHATWCTFFTPDSDAFRFKGQFGLEVIYLTDETASLVYFINRIRSVKQIALMALNRKQASKYPVYFAYSYICLTQMIYLFTRVLWVCKVEFGYVQKVIMYTGQQRQVRAKFIVLHYTKRFECRRKRLRGWKNNLPSSS